MRVGVLEWASCGGAIAANVDLPASIRQEGWAMCRALIDGLHQSGHSAVACLLPELHERDSLTSAPQSSFHRLDVNVDVRSQWASHYRQCDVTIVIAPESAGELAALVAWCRSSGIRTLNCDAQFIEHAGDKWKTANALRQAGIHHPPTWLLSQWDLNVAEKSPSQKWVAKLRDGCGCDEMRCLTTSQLQAFAEAESDPDRWLVQPWIHGRALSRSAIVSRPGCMHWLPSVGQQIEVGETVCYRGGCVMTDLQLPADQAAQLGRAIGCLPGRPYGWVGVDFVLDQAGGLWIIEINPRLTTSFVGLSAAYSHSLVDLLLSATCGMGFAPAGWWRNTTFSADGQNAVH